MTSWVLLQNSLFSPMVLAFFLGMGAVLLKSDLKLPDGLYSGLSLYLLLALGLKGGALLSETPLHTFWKAGLGTLALGIICPVVAYVFGHRVGKLSVIDSAALAAHYGSVSVVTFIAGQVFVDSIGLSSEQFMTALVVILEVPGIIVALMLAERVQKLEIQDTQYKRPSFLGRLRTIVFSKSIFLLLGGLLIGLVSGKVGVDRVKPFFMDPFQGVLVLFMLDMGVVAGVRLRDMGGIRPFLIMFALVMPVINGFLGVVVGYVSGFSLGGATILAAMAASASYIAAPAAVRISLPNANPAYYLTCAIVITFPFNLAIGIPLYYQFARFLFG
jgi:hypothetical protein